MPSRAGARRSATLARLSALLVHHLEVSAALVRNLRRDWRGSAGECRRCAEQLRAAKEWHDGRAELARAFIARIGACALYDRGELTCCLSAAMAIEVDCSARAFDAVPESGSNQTAWNAELSAWAAVRVQLKREAVAWGPW